jgi:hypothetical protein
MRRASNSAARRRNLGHGRVEGKHASIDYMEPYVLDSFNDVVPTYG